jgi:hypothetical protein
VYSSPEASLVWSSATPDSGPKYSVAVLLADPYCSCSASKTACEDILKAVKLLPVRKVKGEFELVAVALWKAPASEVFILLICDTNNPWSST